MDLSPLQGMDDTLRGVTNITHLIHKAVDEAAPLRTTLRTEVPWWNHNLTLAKQSVKRADRHVRLQPTDLNRKDSQ